MIRDLLLKSRSYRSFDSEYCVSRETLIELVENARYTPSSMNGQGLRYKLCYTKEDCDVLLSLVKLAAALPEYHFPPKGHEPTAYIVICAEKELYTRDVGIAAQTIMLSAAEKGLGGCMIGNYDPWAVGNALSLPEEMKPRLILCLGKPDEEIILEDAVSDDLRYYRDENGVHHVPKKKAEELLL